ncbi:MAG: EAL domain-containing protein [Clostridia bacterium]|nr:EAL domain-containing protein [Clostridia bacterium]
MKKDSAIARFFVLVFLGIFAIAIIIAFPLFLTNELDNQNQDFLKEISAKNGESVGFKFQEQASYLYYFANAVDTTKLDNPKAAINSIGDIPKNDHYKRYGIATLDGKAYTSDGKSIDLAHDEHIKECVEKDGFIVCRMKTNESIDGDEVFVMHIPLKHEGETKAVFFLVFTIDQIMANFESSAFNKSEFFFVVDYEGNNIMSTHPNEKFRNIDNVFYTLPLDEKYQGSRILDIQEDMKNGETGVLFSSQNTDFYLYYAPLNFNDWYLFSVIPTSAVTENRNTALSYVGIMTFFLVTVFILFTIYAVSSERRKKEELDKVLYTDSLTGGASYAKFCLDVKKQLSKNQKAAYVVMDLDNFKLVNDYYGYEMGNKTIKHIDTLWRKMLKDNEFVGRIAADRFAVYLRYSSEEELNKRLEKFCADCRTFNDKNMSNYILVPSIGVYYVTEKNIDIQKMQNCAVMAKSLVKGDSESTIAVYTGKIKRDLTRKKLFSDELAHAIRNNELSVVLQPQYNTETGKICAAEMLVRWKREDGTYVPPSEFIPIAEERGFIKDIDRFVFHRACVAQQDLIQRGFEPIDISVNLSQQTLHDPKLIETYLGIIEETGADISHIHLEITETTLHNNQRSFLRLLRRLHKAGFKILLDDFGTGYSSLMLLKSMPIDALKLDKSFIDDYEHPRGRNIIECVIDMTKKLDITIIAEGIETAEQYEYIKSQKCDIVQGYYFSYPLEYRKFCDTIERNQ